MHCEMSVYQLRNVSSFTLDKPVTVAAACAGCVCICAGSRLHIRDEHEQLGVFTLGNEIDVVTCWREEGVCLVAAADRSGCVHILSPLQQTTLCSHHVVELHALPCDQPVFSALEKVSGGADFLCLLAMTSSGCLYTLCLPLHNTTSAEASKLQDNTMSVQLDLTAMHGGAPHVCKNTQITNCPHVLTGGSGIWPLVLWKLNRSPPQLSPSVCVATILSNMTVVQAQTTPDGDYIVTRTEQCEVQVWLGGDVMVMLGVWGGKNGQPHVGQFSLYCHGNSRETQLCMLCYNKQECKQQLVVVSVPTLEHMFSTEVAVNSLLAVGQPGQGSVCVLHPLECGDGTCVDVNILECGSPKDRVAMLVNEGKFEEAGELAQKHNLDPEFVLREKAAMLNRRLCAGEELLPSFLQCLRQMKDVGPIAALVLESNYPSLATTHSVLSAACAEVNSDPSIAQAMSSALDRLTTFSLIAGQDKFSEAWHAFQRGSCLQIVRYLLQNGRLPHAKLFWTRHQLAVQEELSGLDMCALAHILPSDLMSMVSWLPVTILPFILAHCPHQMGEYLAELRKTVCSLELIDMDNWPGNALTLTEGLLASISEQYPCQGWSVDVSPLTELKEKLVRLTSVLAMIQCQLSFETYEQSTAEQLVYRALDQALNPAHIHSLITDRLSQFTQEHQLSLDTVLSSYLKLFLARAPTHSPDFSDSPWEAKAVALTSAVTCSELRVGCCLELLHCVSLPWGSAVASLVQDCLLLDTANAGELRSLYDLLQLKSMLLDRYGIVDFNFSDSNTGQLYIRYILLQKKSSVLADSLRVAAKYGVPEYKVYMHHFYNLCCSHQVEETRDVMNTLPPEVQASTAQATLCFCLHRLKFPHISGQCEPMSHCGAAQLAVLCADVLDSPADWSGDCSAEPLRRVRDLAVEFSVFLSPRQLQSPLHTSQLLLHTLATLSPASVGHCVPAKALRFGKLLGYSEDEVCCQLIQLWTERVMETHTLVSLIERYPAHLSLHMLHSVLYNWPPQTPSLAHCLHNLALQATTVCTRDQLDRALSIFRVSSVLCDLLMCCVGGGEEGVWPWAARFSEQGMMLQLAQVRPAVLQVTATLLPHHSEQSPPGCPPCSGIVDLLQSNGHHSLAHHIALLCQLVQGSATPHASLLSSLMEKVLSMTTVDHSYGLALLLATPPDTALHLLCSRQASIISSYSRVIALCMLTADYCQLVNRPQVRRTAVALMTSALWGKLLRKYQVSFSSAFRGGNEEKRQVLSKLLHLKHIPPHVVLAYCRTYGLDGPGALLTRIRVALTEWDSGYQSAYDAAMAAIRKHPFIPSLLDTFLTSKVCPYDYERIQFVLHQVLPRSDSRHYQQIQLLLSLLVAYDRYHPPSTEEREWHSAHCHSVCKAGQDSSIQRLPLHLLLQPQLGLKLLGNEVKDTSTVARLAPIARLLDIPEDQFYCSAWNVLQTAQLKFHDLNPVLACVSHVPTQLTLTLQLAKQLSDVEKVAALETALCLLRDPACSGHQTDERSLSLQLCEARVRLLLEEAGLAHHCQRTSSTSVISDLYTDLPLQQDRPAPALVHKVVKGIADLLAVDVLTTTTHLLEEWLQPSTSSQQDLNTTLVREMIEVEVENTEDSSTEANWARMVYLLTDNPEIEPLAALLYRWAKAELPIPSQTPRLKALRLLLTAVPQSVVESVSGGSLADLRERVQHAVFVAELASVQITALTVEAFQTCNKQSLACNLLHTQANSPKALRLVVDLCLHYRIVDAALWSKLLDALLSLNMMGFLQRVLPGLVSLGIHYTVPNVSSVWQAAVQAPYEAGKGKDSLAALHLLYQCPVLFKVGLLSIIRTMIGVAAHSHALSACLLLSPTLRTSTAESVLNDVPANGLLQLLEEVTESTSPELALVPDVVYDYVDCSGRYECLLGSRHFPCLVQYLMLHDRLTSLIHASLTRGRVAEAVQLVEMYHANRTSPVPCGMDGLKVYLEMEGTYNLWEHLITECS